MKRQITFTNDSISSKVQETSNKLRYFVSPDVQLAALAAEYYTRGSALMSGSEADSPALTAALTGNSEERGTAVFNAQQLINAASLDTSGLFRQISLSELSSLLYGLAAAEAEEIGQSFDVSYADECAEVIYDIIDELLSGRNFDRPSLTTALLCLDWKLYNDESSFNMAYDRIMPALIKFNDSERLFSDVEGNIKESVTLALFIMSEAANTIYDDFEGLSGNSYLYCAIATKALDHWYNQSMFSDWGLETEQPDDVPSDAVSFDPQELDRQLDELNWDEFFVEEDAE